MHMYDAGPHAGGTTDVRPGTSGGLAPGIADLVNAESGMPAFRTI